MRGPRERRGFQGCVRCRSEPFEGEGGHGTIVDIAAAGAIIAWVERVHQPSTAKKKKWTKHGRIMHHARSAASSS